MFEAIRTHVGIGYKSTPSMWVLFWMLFKTLVITWRWPISGVGGCAGGGAGEDQGPCIQDRAQHALTRTAWAGPEWGKIKRLNGDHACDRP